MRQSAGFIVLLLCWTVPAQSQEFRFGLRGEDAGGWYQELEFGVHLDATLCEDTSLGERNNYLPPPFPFMFSWVNPTIMGMCDGDDCYSCGRISEAGNPALDLRVFTAETQVDTYRVFLYSFDAGYPFQLTWNPLEPLLHCDSLILTYEGDVSGPVTVNMLLTGSHLITDETVHALTIVRYGAKNLSNPIAGYEQESRFWLEGGSEIAGYEHLDYGVHVDASFCLDTLFDERNALPSDSTRRLLRWTNPRAGGECDSADCFGCGRIPDIGRPALDLRPFISRVHIDTFQVSLGLEADEYPFTAYWPWPYFEKCDSLKMVYAGETAGTVMVNMLDANNVTIFDTTVTTLTITLHGVKRVARRAAVECYPAPVLYPVTSVGASQPKWFKVRNNRSAPLHISSIVSTSPDFTPVITSGTVAPYWNMDVMARFTPVDVGIKSAWLVITHDGESSPDSIPVFGTATIPVQLGARWNLVSNPVTTTENGVTQVFPPAATDYAFSYSSAGGYAPESTLTNGRGYWLRFPAAHGFGLLGGVRLTDTTEVNPGWNLIGSLSRPVAASSIVPVGTTIESYYFGYDGGYEIVDTLLPGHGYWVMTSAGGSLTMTATGAVAKAAAAAPVDLSDAFSSLTFTDARGQRQRLYLGVSGPGAEPPRFVHLPPPAPDGSLDARFVSGKFLEVLPEGVASDLPIRIASAAYPVTVEYHPARGVAGAALVVDGRELPFAGSGTLTIDRAPAGLGIRTSPGSAVPDRYSLGVNYPNPFNPVTRIEFDVPEVSHILLVVYDLLGQPVETLVSRTVQPGSHAVEWNPGGRPSGVYYYRLIAPGYTATKRMMFVK